MRYFCRVAYDGTSYHGWQSQKNALGVQQVIAGALSTVLRKEIQITGSGRTDTGVHGRDQVFHFDSDRPLSQEHIHKFNSILPADISINALERVAEDAHARFDASKRSYEYHILKHKDPFRINKAYLFARELNLGKMNRACEILVENRDFECFSRVHTDVDHFLCDLATAFWEERNDLIVFHVSSNRFLRGMVRAMVGTLLDVGTGKINLNDLKTILKSRDRKKAGRSVPARGLYLTKVDYPEKIYSIKKN